MPMSVLHVAGCPHIIRALVLGCILVAGSSAQAASELQRLDATIPPRAKLGFAMYKSCALLTGIDKRNEGATFRDIEAAITATCRKHLNETDRDLAASGLRAADRAKMIEQYSALSLTERRLRAEGKPIPGYQESPETAKFMVCDRKMRAAKSAYASCVDEALRNLIPLSTDTSDVVADAAIGICSAKRRGLVAGLICFSMDPSKANATVSQLDQQLRSSALGKVAAARAEMRRRQMMQEQVPKATPPIRRQPGATDI